mmetsp:Transcript_64067/g.149196  ORF Transcript_64067/g.149196 Transcript_64067/m.149196 type:complete len:205 (+) Transcript_64067:65-679(+)|eukprot:CAMPEP_0171107314 /NCGR_PEP_ID=MMETSP0766_2-20121228/66529_1 /TAXON_ID=439317 /ORGANISM="Gambierdiscus australes, Strain CAWD 149" /LENGTH=204 /DNA_ID=CAMNT_0011568587 /DNA_START=54 /DNA_END=668 /DNA_ORIENTATION=+
MASFPGRPTTTAGSLTGYVNFLSRAPRYAWDEVLPKSAPSGSSGRRARTADAVPKWGPHVWHRSFAPGQKTGLPFYLSVRWATGEELAFVRVRPEDHVGAVRHALVQAIGHGRLRMAYREHLLEDSMEVSACGLENGSIVYAFEPGSCGLRTMLTRQPIQPHMALAGTWYLASSLEGSLPDKESEENLFAARHGLGKKRVLIVP